MNSFGASLAKINYTLFCLSGAIGCQRTRKKLKIENKIKCENNTAESEILEQIYLEIISKRLDAERCYIQVTVKMPHNSTTLVSVARIRWRTTLNRFDVCARASQRTRSHTRRFISSSYIVMLKCVAFVCFATNIDRYIIVLQQPFHNRPDTNQCQRSLFDQCLSKVSTTEIAVAVKQSTKRHRCDGTASCIANDGAKEMERNECVGIVNRNE